MRDPFIGADRETVSPREPSFKMSIGQMGMIGFLASIGMIFGATIIAYLVTRANNAVWRTAEMPGLPLGLLGTTAVMFAQAACMTWALRSVRANKLATLERALWWSLGLGIAFILGQSLNWYELQSAHLTVSARNLYVFTFYMLTGVHALHIVGGLPPLGVVIYKTRRREYSSSRHEGVKFCVQYWHFLGVVWLILLGVLFFAT
ncbi:MAG: cytochrome c oxidase subunit 3 [Polyangiaceae bacterium]